MFLLVSGRQVGAHADGHQHGVSIEISINLGKNWCDLKLGERLCIFTFPLFFSESGLYLFNSFVLCVCVFF